MNKFLWTAIFLMFVSSCSPATSENSDTRNSNIIIRNVSANNSVNQVPNANAQNSAKPTMEEFMNANNIPPVADDAANNANSPQLRSTNSLMDAMQKKGMGKRVNVAPIDPNARRVLTVAPDNSEISTEMNKQGQPVETRTFKDNPSLDKVVRTYITLENPQVKVYLKNGKILDLPKGKIDNPFNVPANEILTAVGVATQKSAPAAKK